MMRTIEIETEERDEAAAERRLLRLFGCLAFVIEEAEKLGLPKTAIEARRTGLQLCYETDSEQGMSIVFVDGIQGHG
jgi:hypothetical protein